VAAIPAGTTETHAAQDFLLLGKRADPAPFIRYVPLLPGNSVSLTAKTVSGNQCEMPLPVTFLMIS
jgi:hypothetical protein